MDEINALITTTPEELTSELESLGSENVRMLLLNNKIQYNYSTNKSMVESWLSEQDRKEALSASRRAEERADSAIDIARFANKIAISAIIFSVITAISIAVIQFIGNGPNQAHQPTPKTGAAVLKLMPHI